VDNRVPRLRDHDRHTDVTIRVMGSMLSFRARAVTVITYAVAMAYLEAAVVVYLTSALGGHVGVLFPLQPADAFGNLAWIEVGREVATLVMIATVGILAGRSAFERFAWAAVVFGAWDIGYYVWLWVFAGWPGSPAATDLLFLLPVPWVGPVWSPVVVSLALVGFGLVAARRLGAGGAIALDRRHWAACTTGGLIVILSYTLGAADVLSGGMPGSYPWPVFVLGMAIATAAAAHAFHGHTADATRAA
jgi:hypothetical protein